MSEITNVYIGLGFMALGTFFYMCYLFDITDEPKKIEPDGKQ